MFSEHNLRRQPAASDSSFIQQLHSTRTNQSRFRSKSAQRNQSSHKSSQSHKVVNRFENKRFETEKVDDLFRNQYSYLCTVSPEDVDEHWKRISQRLLKDLNQLEKIQTDLEREKKRLEISRFKKFRFVVK